MILPNSPQVYDPLYQNALNRELQEADAENFKKDRTVDVGQGRLVLLSPNGTRYEIKVDNSGSLSAVVVT